MSHYEVLDVPPDASFRTVQLAFYRQARLYHPDRKKKMGAGGGVESAAAGGQGEEGGADGEGCRGNSVVGSDRGSFSSEDTGEANPPKEFGRSTSSCDADVGSTKIDSDIDASEACSGGGGSSLRYLRIQAAWECLRDPKLRQEYDGRIRRAQKLSRRAVENAIPIRPEDCRYEDADGDGAGGDGGGDKVCDACWYTCRCGCELNAAEVDDDSDLLECPGCSLVYDASALFGDDGDGDGDDDDDTAEDS